MEINETAIIEDNNEELALACLLAENVCYLNTTKVWWADKSTTVVYVDCSDVFAWGSAEGECILSNDGEPDSEIIALYKYHRENKTYGSTKWVCLKRNEQPQGPLKRMMREAGYWDDQLESLPENYYDRVCREQHEARQKQQHNDPDHPDA